MNSEALLRGPSVGASWYNRMRNQSPNIYTESKAKLPTRRPLEAGQAGRDGRVQGGTREEAAAPDRVRRSVAYNPNAYTCHLEFRRVGNVIESLGSTARSAVLAPFCLDAHLDSMRVSLSRYQYAEDILKASMNAPAPPLPPAPHPAAVPPKDGRCLVTKIPPEILAVIQDLSHEDLTSSEIQQQKHRLMRCCQTFYQAFDRPVAAVVTTPGRATKLAKAIKDGKMAPRSLCIDLCAGFGAGRKKKYANLVRECLPGLAALEVDALGGSAVASCEEPLGVPLHSALKEASLVTFTWNGKGSLSSDDITEYAHDQFSVATSVLLLLTSST